MVNKDRASLQTLRMLSAALKQIEIDQRIEITDEVATREFVRQVKQRQDAATQYRDANRDDLATKEEAEIEIIQRFLPEAMSDEEIAAAVDAAIAESGLPQEMSSMGPLMGKLKPALEGRADMSKVSKYLREKLNS
ncbi:GatB/YqeY domain-containing protein [Cardiobacteriaceae bacterium TAE3-ERU3]|nr:GatB/YqeY domain-containing protein [Cardiobacteriaceae bacterium TAE3-ERU3]